MEDGKMLFVGIDWSKASLDYHVRTWDGIIMSAGAVKPDFNGLVELCGILEKDGASSDEISIVIETTHGAWIHTLLERGYKVYGINPKMIANFRQASSAAGIKTE